MTKDITDTSFTDDGSPDDNPRQHINQAGSLNGGNGQSKSRGSLKQLFEESIRDIYNAEKQLLAALPLFAEACFDDDLKDSFIEHTEHTRRHAYRLEKICKRLHINRHEKRCKIIQGMIEDMRRAIENNDKGPLLDVKLIITAKKIEHYEIGDYVALCRLAKVLRMRKIADILSRSLSEEEDSHKFLSEVAWDVNLDAYEVSLRNMDEQ